MNLEILIDLVYLNLFYHKPRLLNFLFKELKNQDGLVLEYVINLLLKLKIMATGHHHNGYMDFMGFQTMEVFIVVFNLIKIIRLLHLRLQKEILLIVFTIHFLGKQPLLKKMMKENMT